MPTPLSQRPSEVAGGDADYPPESTGRWPRPADDQRRRGPHKPRPSVKLLELVPNDAGEQVGSRRKPSPNEFFTNLDFRQLAATATLWPTADQNQPNPDSQPKCQS